MKIQSSFSVFLFLIADLITSGYGERAKDQMYEHFNGRASCFRRLNATHQTGCSSKRSGSTGVIHFVEQQENLEYILKSGTASKYMPIIPLALLTVSNLKMLESSNKISGLVLYNNTEEVPDHYSHELTCPNPHSNVEKTCSNAWNNGTGILHENIPFPMYYINNDADLTKMRDCFEKFNNFSYETHHSRSLCAIELDAFMFATTNTPTCIRRSNSKTNLNPVKFCDPLGGENVWASLFPIENITRGEEIKSQKFIIVAARLDTTSLFHGSFPGAVNPVTSLVTFLSTAELLKRMVSESSHNEREKNVLFVLFNGESYDYIGSQRLVYDMENNKFPMNYDWDVENPVPLIHLEDISLFVELSQLTKSGAIYIHDASDNTETKNFLGKLKNHGGALVKTSSINAIPPASLQSFLRARSNISGVILADHDKQYVNRYYNSIFDNVTNVDYIYYNTTENGTEGDIPPDSIQQLTANISHILALSLYEELLGKSYTGKNRSRLELIDELYNCYLLDADCKVHQAIQRKKLRETPYNSYSHYVGVSAAPNLLTYAIGLTLGWLTGDEVVQNKTCKSDHNNPMFQYFNMSKSLDDLNTTVCFRTTMNFTEAISPAFVITDYDWSSGKYSSWSESTWKDLTVQMFLKPSASHERFTIAIGSITFVMSLILVYFVKSRSHILFVTPENCSPTNC